MGTKQDKKDKQEAEEAYWASLAGPVTITYKKDKVSA